MKKFYFTKSFKKKFIYSLKNSSGLFSEGEVYIEFLKQKTFYIN